MSRKKITESNWAVISVVDGSADELAALDRMAMGVMPILGRGRRMNTDEITRFGVLVTVLQQIKKAGGKIPRQYLSKAHLKNLALVEALISFHVHVRAGLSSADITALKSGIELPADVRGALSRAASHYIRKAVSYL
jgi:hypothetical protein